MRFAVYRTSESAVPVRVGLLTAANQVEAYESAVRAYAPGPFILKPHKTQSELTSYLQSNGFVRAQDRIGVMVYRDNGGGKRAKNELTVSPGVMMICLYDLTGGRRSLRQSWELGE